MAYRSTTHNKDPLGAVAGHTPALIIDILGMRPMAVIGGVLVDMLFSHARMILFARRTGSTQPRPQGLVRPISWHAFWIDTNHWKQFCEYEHELNRTLASQK